MPKGLTERQRRVIEAIRAWIVEHGYPPTIRELGKRLGIKSLRGVTSHLDAIAKKGFLSRRREARGIRLLSETVRQETDQAVRIPILGRVVVGEPLLAEEHLEGRLVVDATLLGKPDAEHPRTHFALRVRGTGMVGAGLLEGDYVIVQQQPTAADGDLVAVLLGEAVAVRRLVNANDQARVHSEQPSVESIVLPPGQTADILGKVVAVIRKLD